MKIAIMQPYFFPYIGYFQLINSVDRFVFYDDVDYIVKGWVNRNRLCINNNVNYITVPLVGAGPGKKINTLLIHNESNWKRKMIEAIKFSYKKAPYYEQVIQIVEGVLLTDHQQISSLCKDSVLQILKYLNIETEIVLSSSIYNNSFLRAQDRIIDICNQEGANTYINAAGGKLLYSVEDFQRKGIELRFLDTPNFIYQQRGEEFHPYLSMIDVLMFNSKEEVHKILNRKVIE